MRKRSNFVDDDSSTIQTASAADVGTQDDDPADQYADLVCDFEVEEEEKNNNNNNNSNDDQTTSFAHTKINEEVDGKLSEESLALRTADTTIHGNFSFNTNLRPSTINGNSNGNDDDDDEKEWMPLVAHVNVEAADEPILSGSLVRKRLRK